MNRRMALKFPIYLDYQATTPVDPRVLSAMLPYFTEHFGNAASRTHAFGLRAEAAVSVAREAVAEALGAEPREVVFTSGATESNNLALLGAARAGRSRGDHVVTSSIEHRAVLDPCRELEKEGFRITFLSPDPFGATAPAAVAAALTDRTILVSLSAANNEIGTLNALKEIGRVCRERGVLFHTDAAQAFGKIPIAVHDAGIDLLSLSAHKICGPKGAGALYVRAVNPKVRLEPVLFGGGHERGLRPGTLDVPSLVGFGAATRLAMAEREEEQARVRALRDRLEARLLSEVPGTFRNGHPLERLAGNLNVCFPGLRADDLMMDVREVAVSAGSACTSASPEPSHVLRGIGRSAAEAASSLRFGLGRFTTVEEVDAAAERFVAAARRRMA
ncbi:MAG: cysteine desulfurase family protein [Thermoanaerobaculia bacterium]